MSSLRSPLTMEPLEPRAMLAAPTATVSNIWADRGSVVMVVDWANASLDTLDNDDFQMIKVGGPVVNGHKIYYPQQVDGKWRIMYSFPSADNAWGFTDNGTYEWRSPVGNVLSPEGESIADPLVRTGDMWWDIPKARVVSQTMRASDWLIVVQYDTLNGLDLSTIDGNDFDQSYVPGRQPVTVHSIVPWGANSTRVVYQISAPSGEWSFAENGQYPSSSSGRA